MIQVFSPIEQPTRAFMITVTLLGNISVVVNEEPISGDAAQRRRLALLAILAAPPIRSYSRDRLIGYVWPEHDTESARRLLSASLHVLRKALGADVLVSAGDEVVMREHTARIDAEEFRRAVASEDFARAVELYRGPFLDGFYISEAVEFEHWVDSQRQEYAALYRAALEKLAERLTAAGNVEGALTVWRQLAAADPYSGRVAIGLMQALVQTGNRAAALQHARIHAQLVGQEFGAAADAEVEAFARALREQKATAHSPQLPSSEPAVEVRPAAITYAEALPPLAYGPSIKRRHRVRVVSGAVVLLAVMLVFFVPRAPPTIAVLPLPADTAGEYWAAITDDILRELSRSDRLRAIPSSSTLPLLELGIDASGIGKRLHADYVASVRTAVSRGSDSLRVNVEVIKVRTNAIAWAEAYRFPLADVFKVQEAIARAVADAVTGGSALASERREPTQDVDAYEVYLRGSTALAKRNRESLQQALTHFQEAVKRDSTYAIAYARLAQTYALLGAYDMGFYEPSYAYEQARVAALRARQLDPELDEAHAALANIHMNYDRNGARASREFKHALQLNPECSSCRQWLGLLYSSRGEHPHALAQLDTAVRIDPASPLVHLNRANVLYYAQQYDSAAIAATRALDLDSTFGRAHLLLALIDFQRNKRREATRRAELMWHKEQEPVLLAVLAYFHGRNGDRAHAHTYVRRLEAVAAERHVPAEYRALGYIGVGDFDAAFEQLHLAEARRSSGLVYLNVEPLLAPLHTDPRFAALASRTRFDW